jgi:hypothetical protein
MIYTDYQEIWSDVFDRCWELAEHGIDPRVVPILDANTRSLYALLRILRATPNTPFADEYFRVLMLSTSDLLVISHIASQSNINLRFARDTIAYIP